MTKKKRKGQGPISAWLSLNGSNMSELSEHLDLSLCHCSLLCNSKTVPPHVREGLESFLTESGESIPLELLPKGKLRKPGPKKGWLDRKFEEMRREAATGL